MRKSELLRMIAIVIVTLLIYSNDNLNKAFQQDWVQYSTFYIIVIGIVLVAFSMKIFHLLRSIESNYRSLYEQYHDLYMKVNDLNRALENIGRKLSKLK